MQDILNHLLGLQELDREIEKRVQRLESIPREITALKNLLLTDRAREKETQERLKQTKIKRREAEGKIEHLEVSLRKYLDQSNVVKTNEEYTAILHEIAGVKGDIRAIEENVLEFMEQAEELESEVEQVMKELEKVEEQHQKKTDALEEERKSIEFEIEDLRVRRKDVSGRLDQRNLNRYERVRTAIPSLPIAAVAEGGFCSGCHAQITLQRQAEIRKNSELLSCESCGRIVYYKDS